MTEQEATRTWNKVIIDDTKELVKIETWRGADKKEEDVMKNLRDIKKIFDKKADAHNAKCPYGNARITYGEWTGPFKDEKDYEKEACVFFYRAGAIKAVKPRKVSLICHLDTVPPGNLNWNPFEAREEERVYNGVSTPFLIGRGAIDDKGPAVVAFEAFTRALQQAAADEYALKKLEKELILEVLFDTSEETDMSTPHYLNANPDQEPDLGIVFDAYWSVRAEKGIERPIFTISSNEVTPTHPENSWDIVELKSSEGSANMIPVNAEALITGKKRSVEEMNQFAANIYDWYRACPFDDMDYHPADIQVTIEPSSMIKITAKVAGAQHGSAPHQNRANGANPIVSLTNFLAFLVDRDILANNYFGEMCKFIRWAFGTRPFGENHPELLYRFDPVYNEGNGTSYGLTQLFSTMSENGYDQINLGIDVRYAIGHHSKGWNGKEGTIEGDSIFKEVFEELTSRYRTDMGGAKVTVTTRTAFGPDIRSPRNAHLFQINNAYRSIMGENCPMRATGGATDAHGRLNLVTAGALLSENFGPPVNYHGIDEGAPLPDLENSGKILLYILRQELGIIDSQELNPKNICHGCCI
ncbi:MAG: M20/M25/M40 family metallo-hydrolase [Methanotrichaceae archaeon]|nr:M20/M25/M40 family metallo-hydrolase [Methanotrichaceae archaeon]